MGATRHGQPFDADAVRVLGLGDRAWLERELQESPQGRWDKTVVITHFAPSLRSADPRFGPQPTTASFCNADDDLIPRADLWIHGHLHCRHDYLVERAGLHASRVVCQARGLEKKGEAEGYDPGLRHSRSQPELAAQPQAPWRHRHGDARGRRFARGQRIVGAHLERLVEREGGAHVGQVRRSTRVRRPAEIAEESGARSVGHRALHRLEP